MKSYKNILIMKFRNIGDVLLISPLIKNLKLNFPDAKIDIALNKGTEEMVSLNPDINNILIYDRETIKNSNFFKKISHEINFAHKIYKKKYDLVINTTRGDRGTFLSLFSGAKTKIGYPSKNNLLKNVFTHNLPSFEKRHMVEAGLDAVKLLNLPILSKKVQIFWMQKHKNKFKEFLLPTEFIHIHCVSKWMFKCISDQIMAQIIDFCELELSQKVVLTAAPIKQELDKIQAIVSLCKSKPINLAGKLTLKETAHLNSKAKFFIGVDTSVMHISAANDIPVLAFFGPSAAFHWGPWDNNSQNSSYSSKNGIQKMGIHTVIQNEWECIPCSKDGCNGSKISKCLMELNFEKITTIIKELNATK